MKNRTDPLRQVSITCGCTEENTANKTLQRLAENEGYLFGSVRAPTRASPVWRVTAVFARGSTWLEEIGL